jgi:hypothetical protein
VTVFPSPFILTCVDRYRPYGPRMGLVDDSQSQKKENGDMLPPRLEFLFTLTGTVAAPIEIGPAPSGLRRIFPSGALSRASRVINGGTGGSTGRSPGHQIAGDFFATVQVGTIQTQSFTFSSCCQRWAATMKRL